MAVVLLSMGCDGDDVTGPVGIQPTLQSVSPSEGGIGTELTLSGSNFEEGATVTVGGQATSSVEVASSSTIYAKVPSGITGGDGLDVTVENPGGESSTLSGAFTGVAPEVSFVNSATRPSGNVGSTVIVEGRAFGDEQGDGVVLFSDGSGGAIEAAIAETDDWTDSFIVTTVPEGAEDGPITVETPLGSAEPLEFTVTSAASFSPSSIHWTKTEPLPEPASGHSAVYASILDGGETLQRLVYVTGGRDAEGTNLDESFHGQIDEQGEITEWNATASLPEPTAFHASVVATPFNSRISTPGAIYVLGGTDDEDEPVSSVHIGALEEDGSVSSWSSGRSLPEPLHSMGAVLFRSAIYVAGGAGDEHEPTSRVYRAEIDTLGQLGEWEAMASLPSERSYHGFVSFGGYLYAIGGETSAVPPDDGNAQNNDTKLGEIAYARINLRTGELTSEGWIVNDNTLPKVRSKHSTLVAGGNLFVSSGLYAGAGQGSSENTYAQIFSDGTVGEFNGATGSNTLLTEGGTNLFNQAAISYIDGEGVAHVMILGGDNVSLPGNKQSDVLYY